MFTSHIFFCQGRNLEEKESKLSVLLSESVLHLQDERTLLEGLSGQF